MQGDRLEYPLLLTADPKLLAMAIGDNLVAMFHLTAGRPEAAVAAPMLAWARPVIIIVVALVGVWHFRMRGWVAPLCIPTEFRIKVLGFIFLGFRQGRRARRRLALPDARVGGPPVHSPTN